MPPNALRRHLPLLILHRMFPVIGEQLVAPRQTPSAIGGLLETDRQFPGVEGNRIPHVAGIVGRVGIVACPAGASLYRFVDMDEMQVLIAVPESGQFCGSFVFGQGFFMAHVAQLVVFRVIAGIKNRGEVFTQNSEIFGTVGIVTPRAILLLYGAVKIGIGIQQGLHICHPRRTGPILPVMAAHAEVRRLHGQLLDVIGYVGVMAGQAFFPRGKSLVLHGRRVDIRLFFLMAAEAELFRAIGLEVVPVLAAMGVMAGGAGLLDGSMGELFVFECLGLIGMTFETDGVDGCPQQFGEIALMYGMAGGATPHGNRPMDELALHDGAVVAFEAEFRAGGTKLIFIGGLVRVVAGEAFALLDRCMDILVGIKTLMTLGAQLARVLYGFERVFPRRLVAEGAFARCHGTMNILFGTHFAVTIGGHAGCFGGSGLAGQCKGIVRGTGGQEEQQTNSKHHNNTTRGLPAHSTIPPSIK